MHTIPRVARNKKLAGVLSGMFFGLFAGAQAAFGAVLHEGTVTLTFDDATAEQYMYARPITKEAGQKGVLYAPTGLLGTEGHMHWLQAAEMYQDGWEIAGHSVTHAELPEIPLEQMRREVRKSFVDLYNRGFYPENFATPFGAYTPTAIAEIAKTYNSHRGFHEVGQNRWPYNKYYLHVERVTNQTTLAEVEGWINAALADGNWLIIVFHDIVPTPEADDTYSWSTENLSALMGVLEAKGIKAKTMKEALAFAQELLPSGTFENGFGSGSPETVWRTDSPSKVTLNKKANGSFPSPITSVRMVGNGSAAHLFSPYAAVDSALTYGVRVFVNAEKLNSGELGFYVDEYDALGNWISGRWLGATGLNFVVDESYAYTPTSPDVAKVSVQAYLTAGSSGTAFIDNVSLFLP